MKRVILLEKCPNGKITKGNWFVDLLSDMELKDEELQYPNSVLFFKNDKYIFNQNYKNDKFWVNYKVWLVIETKFNLNISEVRRLIKHTIEKHFKIKISIPTTTYQQYNPEM